MLAFQPHRYTRRIALRTLCALSQADAVLLTDVAAGEAPLIVADVWPCRALRVSAAEPIFIENVEELPQAIADFVMDGDVVLIMGVGSVSGYRQSWERYDDGFWPGGRVVWRRSAEREVSLMSDKGRRCLAQCWRRRICLIRANKT